MSEEQNEEHGQPELLERAEEYFAAASSAFQRGDYDAAVSGFNEAFDLLEQLPHTAEEQAFCLDNLGSVLARRSGPGDHTAAITRFTQALDLFEQLPHTAEEQAFCLYKLGTVLDLRGDPGDLQAAITRFTQALDLYEQLPDTTDTTKDRADCMYNLGIALQNQGDIDAAVTRYTQALTLFEQLPDTTNTTQNHANCLNNLGLTLALRGDPGDLQAAITHYTQALSLYEQLPHTTNTTQNHARCLNNLGNALQNQGDHTAAITHYTQALTLYEQLPHTTDEEEVLHGERLGALHALLRNYAEAESHYRRVLDLLDSPASDASASRRAHTLTGLAYALTGQSRDQEAEILLARARDLYSSDPDSNPTDHVSCLMILFSLVFRRAGFDEAREIVDEARALTMRKGVLPLFHEANTHVASTLAGTALRMSAGPKRDKNLTTAIDLIAPTALATDADRFQFDTEAQRSMWFHHVAEPRMELALHLAYELHRLDLVSELSARWRMVGTLATRSEELSRETREEPDSLLASMPLPHQPDHVERPPSAPTTRQPGPQLLMPYKQRTTLTAETEPSVPPRYARYR